MTQHRDRGPAAPDSQAGAATGDFEMEAPAKLLPPGDYPLRLDYWTTKLMFGTSAKVVLWFTVAGGEHLGEKLARYYNASKLIGPIGKGGRFKLKQRSVLAIQYMMLMANQPNAKGLSLSALQGVPLVGTVRTVSKNAEGVELPPAMQYSVIDELRRRP